VDSPSQWDIDQVCQWLLTLNLAGLRDKFKASAIDGTELQKLDIGKLVQIGVADPYHHMIIQKERAVLFGTPVSGAVCNDVFNFVISCVSSQKQ
jgi:hypothetical protein